MTWRRTIFFNLYYHPLTNIHNISLSEKRPCSKLFWSVFCHIWTEYGEILCISPYSVPMRENTHHKTPNTDTFYALHLHKIYRNIYKILTYSLNSTVAISKIIDKPDVKLLLEKGNFRTFFLDKILLLV